jgi:hypothetical protein
LREYASSGWFAVSDKAFIGKAFQVDELASKNGIAGIRSAEVSVIASDVPVDATAHVDDTFVDSAEVVIIAIFRKDIREVASTCGIAEVESARISVAANVRSVDASSSWAL